MSVNPSSSTIRPAIPRTPSQQTINTIRSQKSRLSFLPPTRTPSPDPVAAYQASINNELMALLGDDFPADTFNLPAARQNQNAAKQEQENAEARRLVQTGEPTSRPKLLYDALVNQGTSTNKAKDWVKEKLRGARSAQARYVATTSNPETATLVKKDALRAEQKSGQKFYEKLGVLLRKK